MGSLEAAARDWLSDPPWNKVFKNSFDVIEDQVNRGLVALAAIALAVRFLANLPSGDLLCIVVAVNGTLKFDSLAGPFHASLSSYAAQDPACHNAVFSTPNLNVTGFVMYGPVIIMLQAILLIGVEKLWIIFPRLSQKLERFYKSVVEEALLGKDPDVAEDFAGGAISMDKVVRERQREEICGALRGSSIFYQLYILKNFAEIFLASLFVVVNSVWGLESKDELGICYVPMADKGAVTMQCRQKRYDFYMTILWAFNALLLCHVLTSIISIIWSLKITGLRRITSIIDGLKKSHHETTENLIESKGRDFLFLFDLVAHTCGQPATLRVLSYTAPTFAQLCQPSLQNVTMTENSIKLSWKPCPLQHIESSKRLIVQKYVATIFPFSRHHMKTILAQENEHEVEFKDLVGGKREYVVTLSAIIGDAKMKGVNRTTYLPPFPPQKLNCINVDSEAIHATKIKINWTRPKGEFEKYILKVLPVEPRKHSSSLSPPSYFPYRYNNSFKHNREREPDEIWLGSEEVEYEMNNLKPGERYQLELRTMTGNQTCIEEKVPRKLILTKPLPPNMENFSVESSSDCIFVSWTAPEADGHTFMEGYKIQVKSKGHAILREVLVSKHTRHLTVGDIILSATEYSVSLSSVCRDQGDALTEQDLMSLDHLESVSNQIGKTVVTPPQPPSGIKLEASASTSLKVKWDPPAYFPPDSKLSYNVGIQPLSLAVKEAMTDDKSKEIDSNVFTFSHLPQIIGTGEAYRVSVQTVVNISGKSYQSESLSDIFTTKPLPPEKLTVIDATEQIFSWLRSPTPKVQNYKLKIKKDTEKSTDYWVTDLGRDPSSSDVRFLLPLELEVDGEYKINIYSEVENGGNWIESEPLFSKVTKYEDMGINADTDIDTERDVFDGPKITRIALRRNQTKVAGERPNIFSKVVEDALLHSNDAQKQGNNLGALSQQTSIVDIY
eukprot:GFUD01001954.1.p1 GENE.GFUD01001954.1~~GFUD01001954.1.p1  ORF type:complete len:952 (+),score=205.85 GFUD01001954.1:214-3069(+)